MSKLAALQSAASRADVAKLLQTTLQGLTYILYAKPIQTKYQTFEIPKRGGGTRLIKAPEDDLKLLQQKLSDLLQDCVEEIDAAKKRKDRVTHGFRRKRSILTNAREHRHRRWVFNLDLLDFFPSIHFGRVRGYLLRDKNFALPEHVATLLAQIACDGQTLPQGSPCSPVISNLVAHTMDMHIVRLAARFGCTYTRYADDLTFSTNRKAFPPEIAVPSETEPHVWLPGSQLREIIDHSDFRVNARKTRMQYRDSRQDVTGLVVNQKINIRREYRHTVRAMVHRLFSTGTFEISAPVTKDGTTTLQKREGKLAELHGRLGFIDGIDLYNKKNAPQVKGSGNLPTKESMYRQFLIYQDFYAAQTPVVICEGETDNVYLTHAIRSLAAEFPELAEIDANGKIRIKVRLYKYSQSSTARILGLNDGGSACLSSFIANYRKIISRFHAPSQAGPIVVLYDNDSGAKSIRNVIKEASKHTFQGTEAFVHVVRNMYAVPTPLLGKAHESTIEGFFDHKTRDILVRGKSFHPSQVDFDKEIHYGKKVFAHRVVREHARSIDFTGFRPLLKNLTLAIQAYADPDEADAQGASRNQAGT